MYDDEADVAVEICFGLFADGGGTGVSAAVRSVTRTHKDDAAAAAVAIRGLYPSLSSSAVNVLLSSLGRWRGSIRTPAIPRLA